MAKNKIWQHRELLDDLADSIDSSKWLVFREANLGPKWSTSNATKFVEFAEEITVGPRLTLPFLKAPQAANLICECALDAKGLFE